MEYSMSNRSQWLTRIMIGAMSFALCGGPELMQAQSTPQASTPQSATPDPSRGPQQPAGNQPAAPLPEAPSADMPSTTPATPSTSSPSRDNANTSSSQAQSTQAPTGAAAAQRAETAGGAASKPAGNAIAPAKQRQTRSLLIKVGAIAAAGAAAGIIYGLSRGTGSLPPGATRTTATAAGGH
jgi:cobalamin biosynthesis Mg chelatase CobN